MNTTYISLGSNLGNREKYIQKALKHIQKSSKIIKKSQIYETEPVGFKEQNYFLNMVIEIETNLSPQELLENLQEIEYKLERKREIPKGPRTIDIDILLYENKIIESDTLIVPHKDLENRNFVLTPLKEIASDFKHPIFQKSIEDLHKELTNPESIKVWTKKR